MKTTIKFFTYSAMICALLFTSCDPEDGEDGMDGAQGEQGISGQDGTDGQDGEDGNANVIASEWIDTDFSTNAATFSQFLVEEPLFTQDILDSAVIHVFGKFPNDAVTNFPYQLRNESYDFFAFSDGDLNAIVFTGSSIDFTTNEVFEFFEQVRYVIIPSATTRSSSSSTAIDYTDYEAVREAYNLED